MYVYIHYMCVCVCCFFNHCIIIYISIISSLYHYFKSPIVSPSDHHKAPSFPTISKPPSKERIFCTPSPVVSPFQRFGQLGCAKPTFKKVRKKTQLTLWIPLVNSERYRNPWASRSWKWSTMMVGFPCCELAGFRRSTTTKFWGYSKDWPIATYPKQLLAQIQLLCVTETHQAKWEMWVWFLTCIMFYAAYLYIYICVCTYTGMGENWGILRIG